MEIMAQVIEKNIFNKKIQTEQESIDINNVYYFIIPITMDDCPSGHMYTNFQEKKLIIYSLLHF